MVLSQLSNQVFLYNVGIPLSGCDRRMSKKLLYNPDVHAVPEEKSGDGVS
jgi:hypothetical protein